MTQTGCRTPHTAALLITTAKNTNRFKPNTPFAHLRIAFPIPASSGRTTEHQPTNPGNRNTNRVLQTILITQLGYRTKTKPTLEQQTVESLTKKNLARYRKHQITHQLFHTLRTDLSTLKLATWQSQIEDFEGAITLAQEATRHYRTLANDNPDAYLHNLATWLFDTDDLRGAIQPAQEAVTCYRTLANDNPDTYLPDLAMSLHTLAGSLLHLSTSGFETGTKIEAGARAAEDMQILLPFATKSPARFNELLAGLRRVYLVAYGVSGRELDGALLDRVEGILGLEEPEAPSPGRSQPSGPVRRKGWRRLFGGRRGGRDGQWQ